MKKQIRAHEQRNVKSSGPSEPSSTPLPQYLLDRTQPTSAKALSSAIKNKRAEKAAKFSVPLPRVRGIAEEEMFKVVKTGKKIAKKGWKRMITKPTFGKDSILTNFLSRVSSNPLTPFRSQPVNTAHLLPPFTPETTDISSYPSWTRLHPPPCEIRALYPTYGAPL